MSKRGKLQALQKTYELSEQQAFEAKRRIEEIFEQRKRAMDELVREKEELEVELRRLRAAERRKALQRGDAEGLAGVINFERRVEAKLLQITKRLTGKQEEFERARGRLEGAEAQLVQARIAKKKVEKFLDNREHAERILDSAREEAIQDEMSSFRRGRS